MKSKENKYFLINYSLKLEPIIYYIISNLNKKYVDILKFFNLSSYRKITINLYDDLDNFKDFVSKIRGINKNELPDYCKGTFDNGMINYYLEYNKNTYEKSIRNILHEFVHIIYLEKIIKNNYENRIIWLDEGLAMNLSGEFKNVELKKIISEILAFKELPNLNLIKHGIEFVNNRYDGYLLSYISVKYLIEMYGNEEFLKLIENKEKIMKIGNNIIKNAVKYYERGDLVEI